MSTSRTSVSSTLYSTDDTLNLPTRWSDSARHPALSLSANGRDLMYRGPSSRGIGAAAARTAHPIPPACGIYYYEVKILRQGHKCHISIGFAEGEDKLLSHLPGWKKNSWGYHGDDGCSYHPEADDGIPFGPTFSTGDIIGCGVDFRDNKGFYTINGALIGMVFDDIGKDCLIFPMVGLRHADEAIHVNFGQEPFAFDINNFISYRRLQLPDEHSSLNRVEMSRHAIETNKGLHPVLFDGGFDEKQVFADAGDLPKSPARRVEIKGEGSHERSASRSHRDFRDEKVSGAPDRTAVEVCEMPDDHGRQGCCCVIQ